MLVYVRGAGDIATGVAARLVRVGVSVVMADIAVPTCIRRTISFCEAIRLGEVQVEGIRARLAQTSAEALEITEAGMSPWWWTPGADARRTEACGCGRRDSGQAQPGYHARHGACRHRRGTGLHRAG